MAGIVGAEHGGTGGDPLASVLSLIADKDAFAKRVAELKSAQEQAESVLALVGPANEVLKAREAVKRELDMAKKTLADARSQAAVLVDEARGRAAAIEEEAAEIVARANAQLAVVEATQKEAEQLGLVASQVKAQAEQDIKNAQAVKASYEQQNATLKAVAEQFKAALGGA
jgi:hypothetical protein